MLMLKVKKVQSIKIKRRGSDSEWLLPKAQTLDTGSIRGIYKQGEKPRAERGQHEQNMPILLARTKQNGSCHSSFCSVTRKMLGEARAP
jgi:hypothetical protein